MMDVVLDNGRGKVIPMLLNWCNRGAESGIKVIFASRWHWDVTRRICQGRGLDKALQDNAEASLRPEAFTQPIRGKGITSKA